MEISVIRLRPHQDIKQILDDWSKEHMIRAACILSCVGSLERVCIRFAGKKELNVQDGKFEIISLAGTLSLHGSHLHISVADENGHVRGGHLKEGSLVNTTAEIMIGVLPALEFRREWDDETGYLELKIQ